MSIEMLTTAARAAGYAMAPSEDMLAEPKQLERATPAVRPQETTTVVNVARTPAAPGMWSFWKMA